ncbi:peroxidase 57-like [Triticum urartu]|uniref:Peroxidase n=1 Tax=Triticum urartu TaxID=4572 RepID=A0A8R7P236_TRIUA|nr:peroxidase 57-like [Triticum dicoccoides]XP_048553400.1 peroxidase 57-like [Triticum urartu]
MQPAGSASRLAVLVAVVVLASSAACCRAQLASNYYAGKCGNASVEAVIQSAVQARLAWDKRMVAGLLHMLFHDCFVQGCDASLLLDGPNTEKTAPQNSGIFGYDFIDDIKSDLEAACPGVVSCADIIIAATRDAIALCGGPSYAVTLGRRDGMVSVSWMAGDLPSPHVDIPTAIAMFAKKGFNSFEMATLMGAHTVGVTHCSVIEDRLYNFNGTGKADPSMDPTYAWVLTTYACQKGQPFDNIVYLDDPSSILIFDRSYFNQIKNRRGVLPVDQALGIDPATSWMVEFFATTDFFPAMFAHSITKMAALEVKTGTAGEIRRNCRVTN